MGSVHDALERGCFTGILFGLTVPLENSQLHQRNLSTSLRNLRTLRLIDTMNAPDTMVLP